MPGNKAPCGGCQCGRIRYRLLARPKMLYACHCSDCQKQSSSAFGMSLIIDRAKVEFTAGEFDLKLWQTKGEDGAIKRCAFCPECGSRIYHGGEQNDEISIKAGSLDDTSRLQPVAQIWLRSAQPWLSFDTDQYQCSAKEPADEATLARQWQQQPWDE